LGLSNEFVVTLEETIRAFFLYSFRPDEVYLGSCIYLHGIDISNSVKFCTVSFTQAKF